MYDLLNLNVTYEMFCLVYSPLNISKARFVDEPDSDGGGVIDCPGWTSPIGPAGEPILVIDP
jgi:hypothetical protein